MSEKVDESSKRVLVFSPHPDDAEIAMGGVMARLLDEGWEVFVVDITNGEPTPAGSEEIRAAETQEASKALGIRDRICLGLPNRFLAAKHEYRRRLAQAIRQYRPRWLFTAFLPDAHPDHTYASRLTEEARFVAKFTKTDLDFEAHYPEKIFYYYCSHLPIHPQPRLVVDVTEQWDRKIKAVSAYQSQFWLNQKDPKRKGWIIEQINVVGRYFGSRIGVKYAEPFYCHELVGISKMSCLL
ncbi:MAG: hypothetical protein AMJ79_02615 [Phycisphaerae bacterium SM23_30]|nr:MAG: hypothetical protein AMJ79_02615 [Phycisphaerae bacterium SM23_30]